MKRTKRVLGLALAAAMCMGLLAGCGGTPSNSETPDSSSTPEASEKVLNIATIGETSTLSPLYMIADNRPTQKLLYEGLVKYVDGEIEPVLAENWELSEDGTQLTFYLRQGVTFHDGEPFNAEAAIANIESWHINPSFASLPGVVSYTNIEAVDEYTIRLTYDNPYYAYINDFCWPDVCTMISPKLITQGDFQTVNGYAGTGPYIYDEYVAGQYTTFVRNENYWGEQPYYKSVYNKGRTVAYHFICPRHAMLLDAGCPNAGGLRENDLKAAVYEVLRFQMAMLTDAESVIQKVSRSSAARSRRTALDNEIVSVQGRLKKLDTLRQTLFESYVDGIVTQADYLFGKSRYEDEARQLEGRLQNLQAEKDALPEANPKQNRWFSAFAKFRDEKELIREMLLALVEKIYVNEDKQVHIVLNYQDEMKKLFQKEVQNDAGDLAADVELCDSHLHPALR